MFIFEEYDALEIMTKEIQNLRVERPDLVIAEVQFFEVDEVLDIFDLGDKVPLEFQNLQLEKLTELKPLEILDAIEAQI